MPKKRKRKSTVDRRQSKDISKLKEQVSLLVKTVETKCKDNTVDILAIGTIPLKDPLTDLVVWDTNSANSNINRNIQREGNSVVVKSYRFRGYIELPHIDISSVEIARARIIVAHAPCSEEAEYRDIIESLRIDSFKKVKPPNPYRILYDKVFNLQNTEQRKFHLSAPVVNASNSTAVEPCRRNVDINLKFPKGLQVDWLQGQTNSPPVMGGLCMYLISDQPSIGPPSYNPGSPHLVGYSRLRFQDL